MFSRHVTFDVCGALWLGIITITGSPNLTLRRTSAGASCQILFGPENGVYFSVPVQIWRTLMTRVHDPKSRILGDGKKFYGHQTMDLVSIVLRS